MRLAAKKGFTFIEMLAVIGIIAILIVVTATSYAKYAASGETAKCHELVRNTATALAAIFNRDGFWPKTLRNGEDGKLDAVHAYPLAYNNYMTLSSSGGKLSGCDRFGIVTPWAAAVIKRRGSNAKLTDRVPTGGTIEDHILHFAVDLDGDGIIPDVRIGGDKGGKKITLRATVAVWCCGRNGVIEAWTSDGKGDNVYSFSTAEVKDEE